MFEFNKREEQLQKFEKIIANYYRKDPVEDANRTANRAVEEYNAAVAAANQKFEATRRELEREAEALKQVSDRLADTQQKLTQEQQNSASSDAYIRLVDEFGALLKNQKALHETHSQRVKIYNEELQASDRKLAQLKEQAEKANLAANAQFKEYQAWLKDQGPEKFLEELNRYYASLREEARSSAPSGGFLQQDIAKIRACREEISTHTKKQQERLENGVLLVDAVLGGVAAGAKEKCCMVVEIAANTVSISPEMVEVLDIEEYVGGEVEVLLPAGFHTKALQVLIPSISVDGKTAEYVKAIIIKEAFAGVDGCLGLSFLNRFDFIIEGEKQKRLLLKPQSPKPGAPAFDVFISYNTKDGSFAREVYHLLEKSGYQPFLSEISITGGNFIEAIDAALDSAQHLVVVGSSKENIGSSWVKEEWLRFEGQKRAGKKRGSIIPILCDQMTVHDLPITLAPYNALFFNNQNWKTELIRFLPKYRN